MNVYVRELVSALAQAGVDCTTYVRRWRDDLPDVVAVEPGFRVVHIDAGPPDLPKEALPAVVDEFADGVMAHIDARGGVDVVHANYWLSGVAGHRMKHELGLPLVSTFHTLSRVKAEGGDREPARRERAEMDVIGCADAICVSCTEEAKQLTRLYGGPARADRDRGARGGPRLLRPRRPPGRPAGPRPRRPPGAAVRRAHPAPEGRRRGRAGAGSPAPARRRPGDRGRGERRSAASRRSRSWPPWWTSTTSATGSASCRPSPTTSCRATTAPPTWCWCRRGRRASGSSPWRRRRAARRGGRRRRRPPHAGRPRPHRLPRAGPRRRGVRRLRRRAAVQRPPGVGDGAPAPPSGPAGTRGRWRPRGCGGSTPISRWERWWTAA